MLTFWDQSKFWYRIINLTLFNFHFDRKEISLIRIRGFIISSIYALFFSSSAMAGFISVMILLFTDNSLTSFKVFTLLTLLTNVKMIVTIFIADSLRYLADARTACRRMQNLIEKRSMFLTGKMDHQYHPSTLDVYFKGRKYKHQFIRIESFRNGKPALLSVQKLKQRKVLKVTTLVPLLFGSRISFCYSRVAFALWDDPAW